MFGLRSAKISQIAFAPAREIKISAAAIRSLNSGPIYSYWAYPFVSFSESSNLPLPHKWITWNFCNSSGNMPRTASLTATAPRLPPMIRRTGFVSSKPQNFSRLPLNNSWRIGEPVSTAFSAGICFIVSGKLVHTRCAHGMQILLARPGVISDSWITQGMWRNFAANTTGTDTNPPLENTTSGLILPNNRIAWPRPFTTLKGSLKFLTSI